MIVTLSAQIRSSCSALAGDVPLSLTAADAAAADAALAGLPPEEALLRVQGEARALRNRLRELTSTEEENGALRKQVEKLAQQLVHAGLIPPIQG